VTIFGIKGGTKWRGKGSDRTAAIRQPGFAVDRAGQAAYVIDPEGVVARVDLTTLDVSYHAKGTRRLARATKQINGPMSSARWVGDGRIAVSGTNAKLRKDAGRLVANLGSARRFSSGHTHVTSRMLDPIARSFTAKGDVVLIAGNRAQGDNRRPAYGRRHCDVAEALALPHSQRLIVVANALAASVTRSRPGGLVAEVGST
jgi:hypothetical protein